MQGGPASPVSREHPRPGPRRRQRAGADSAARRTVLQVFRGPSAGVAFKIAWDTFSSTLAYLMGSTRSFDPIPQVDGTKYASVLENVSQGTRAHTPWTTLGYTVETRTHPVGNWSWLAGATATSPAPERRPGSPAGLRDRPDRHSHAARQDVDRFTDRQYTGRVLVVYWSCTGRVLVARL